VNLGPFRLFPSLQQRRSSTSPSPFLFSPCPKATSPFRTFIMLKRWIYAEPAVIPPWIDPILSFSMMRFLFLAASLRLRCHLRRLPLPFLDFLSGIRSDSPILFLFFFLPFRLQVSSFSFSPFSVEPLVPTLGQLSPSPFPSPSFLSLSLLRDEMMPPAARLTRVAGTQSTPVSIFSTFFLLPPLEYCTLPHI